MDWSGTFDPTPWTCVADSIQFLENLMPGGITALMAHNQQLALQGRDILAEQLGLPKPIQGEMIGSLATLPLPDESASTPDVDRSTMPTPTLKLQNALFEQFQIEVPCFYFPEFPNRAVRISAQAYNHPDQYRRLASALQELL